MIKPPADEKLLIAWQRGKSNRCRRKLTAFINMTLAIHLVDIVLGIAIGIAIVGLITWMFFQLTNRDK